ncbi:hypothetical protein CON68_21570 [Bacillus toyonensis]|nr:hypothetical protein CON68_21570 [Bacillus toyonensis]PEC65098.1 hypothetical protein CON62_23525 [Bacillus toyonensis]PEI48682.1 hypothetical protein CN631_18045 [Bacillus toyonensis]PEJ08716.1 hypothetical protein CN682_28970 [Bacillus toyonensis]PGE72556.1 hypothetical protein COM70_25325 [Bacillus toyonensis]
MLILNIRSIINKYIYIEKFITKLVINNPKLQKSIHSKHFYLGGYEQLFLLHKNTRTAYELYLFVRLTKMIYQIKKESGADENKNSKLVN